MSNSSCGASIYNPDTSNREVMDCEIVVSAQAVSILEGLMDGKEMWLYIMVKGGGCSGYIYELELLEDEPTNSHQVISTRGGENRCSRIRFFFTEWNSH